MIISVNNVTFGYRCFSVLKGVDFMASGGQLVCMLGKNGAGKSTLFNCILNISKNYKGVITVDGEDTRKMTPPKLSKKIAYIPQSYSGKLSYSVMDMVLMGTSASVAFYSSPGKKQMNLAEQAIKLLNIVHLKDRNYSHLSGGEQQLVLIARAIAQEAKILLMDEPCSNLDYGNQIIVLKKLRELAESGYLIILSTHNPMHAFLYADNVLLLNNGIVSGYGAPNDILTEAQLKSIYGVDIALYSPHNTNIKVCIPHERNDIKYERCVGII